MRALHLLALAAVVAATTAEAQDDKVWTRIWGAGTSSCGEFLKVVAENPRNETAFAQWLHGYISGRNFSDRGVVVDYAAGLDRAALMIWVTNHCKNNPLDLFFTAVEALITELTSRGRIERW